jgi:hypothetical protein
VSEDEEPPPGGGLFRRLAPGEGSAIGGALGVFETIFAPGGDHARQEIQRQRHTGARNPSATDPPDDDASPEENRVAAQGRAGTPFSGRIVIRGPH